MRVHAIIPVLGILLAAVVGGCSDNPGRDPFQPVDLPPGFFGEEVKSVPIFQIIEPAALPLTVRLTLTRDGWDESFPVAYSISDTGDIKMLPQELFTDIDNLPRNILVVWVGLIDEAKPSIARTLETMQLLAGAADNGMQS